MALVGNRSSQSVTRHTMGYNKSLNMCLPQNCMKQRQTPEFMMKRQLREILTRKLFAQHLLCFEIEC